MSKQERAVTKDRLIGMTVVDADGNSAGTIKDIAFTVGKMGMTMIVETKKGEDKEVPWERIQAAADYVLLKPSTVQAQNFETQLNTQQSNQQPTCPTCKGSLSYIQQYQRWYCYKCQKYA